MLAGPITITLTSACGVNVEVMTETSLPVLGSSTSAVSVAVLLSETAVAAGAPASRSGGIARWTTNVRVSPGARTGIAQSGTTPDCPVESVTGTFRHVASGGAWTP